MHSSRNNLNRRRFVAALGAATGFVIMPAVGVERALAVASDYVRKPVAQLSPGVFFDQSEMQALRAVCDLVIPRTETPGAVDTDVHGFLDNQILRCHSDEEQRGAKLALAAIERLAKTRFLKSFKDGSVEQQLAVLSSIESRELVLSAPEYDGFRFLKSMIVFGYFTSEEGATLELAFDSYPGRFIGSVPYGDIGRAWFKG